MMITIVTKNKYQKIDGSRKIAPYLNPRTNTSKSFNALYKTLSRLLTDAGGQQHTGIKEAAHGVPCGDGKRS
jgi:hypothetical protein